MVSKNLRILWYNLHELLLCIEICTVTSLVTLGMRS